MAQPVELHIVSDSTGETAARLVQALEAQFPEQEFEEVRHPRCETVVDLERAVASARGHAAVVIYTLVDPELRDAMRRLCRRARVHYCDLLGHPIDAVARVSGQAAQMTPGARQPLDSGYFKRMAAIEFAVKYDDGMGAASGRPTSSSLASRGPRRRRYPCTSATSATRPRTSRS